MSLCEEILGDETRINIQRNPQKKTESPEDFFTGSIFPKKKNPLNLLLRECFFYLFITDAYLVSDPPSDQVFLAAFRVTGGDSFTLELADPSTEAFRIRSREYRDRLNLAFRRSSLKISFITAEVLALDG